MNKLRQEWFSNIRSDLLAGLVVALALIPEAIAFSIIAGVDPRVGLYASFCIAVVIAFAGGRPGMISAATGAMGAWQHPWFTIAPFPIRPIPFLRRRDIAVVDSSHARPCWRPREHLTRGAFVG